jgi:hypothetical protein
MTGDRMRRVNPFCLPNLCELTLAFLAYGA